MQFDLGPYADRVQRTLEILDKQSFGRRIWEKDPSLWRQDDEGSKIIEERLGWLGIVADVTDQTDGIIEFAEEVKADGFRHAVLMGMGGSSLCPEVSRLAFGVKPGYPDLIILDTTVPDTILSLEKSINISKTLFIISTKSGTTVETLSAYRYFRQKADGKQFVAITDPDTPLEDIVHESGFRGLFSNPPDIGGRFSALSFFGLVPAAIIGVDIDRLLDRSAAAMKLCGPHLKSSQNQGVVLGTIMAELALMGRDKLVLNLSPRIASLGAWIEQLVAESTGKQGTGILPVDADYHGDDALAVFVSMRDEPPPDTNEPFVHLILDDEYDVGGQYFLWEFATAVASALLGVNAFDQPNVQAAKDLTSKMLVSAESGVKSAELGAIIAFLQQYQPGNYIALMAFLHKSDEVHALLGKVQTAIQHRIDAPVTLGYGPRFLHSTGQFHKGGPNNGLFVQFTADDAADIDIPGADYTFGKLKQAQAAGDALALQGRGRPFIRLHLGGNPVDGLKRILHIIEETTQT